MNQEEFDCATEGCTYQRLSSDQIYICVGCDGCFCISCYQTTGRYLTQDELGDEYNEDDLLWYCKDCAITN